MVSTDNVSFRKFQSLWKGKEFDLGGLRLQRQKYWFNLYFQTSHTLCTINVLKYLSGILSDEKKSGLRFVSEWEPQQEHDRCGCWSCGWAGERKTKNKQNRAMGQAGDTHGTLGAESRMCPRYSHHYECGTHSGPIVSLALWFTFCPREHHGTRGLVTLHYLRYVDYVKIWRRGQSFMQSFNQQRHQRHRSTEQKSMSST